MAEPLGDLEIIGTGRAGIALGARLLQDAVVQRLTFSGRGASHPDHPLFADRDRVHYRPSSEPPRPPPDAVILAVPDAAIGAVAARLATRGLPPATPVLHLSGALTSAVLSPLAERGHPTASLHPLVAFSAAEGGSLRGVWFTAEGAGEAMTLAERLVAGLGGRLLRLGGADRALYHAAAVAASNFVVALLGVAERWMGEAGLPPAAAREGLATLAVGAVESVRRMGATEALTGPVSRGDAGTVEAHLARLSGGDRRLYSVLSLSALDLARQRGLDPAAAAALARLLEPTE